MNRIYFGRRSVHCGFAALFLCFTLALPAEANPLKTFLIFFDWGSANVDASAQGILEEATHDANHSSITVVGHCDTSEAKPDRLSLARAKAIRAALLQIGVLNNAKFSVRGVGASDPLVPTGPGVRKPQNRRVVITIAN